MEFSGLSMSSFICCQIEQTTTYHIIIVIVAAVEEIVDYTDELVLVIAFVMHIKVGLQRLFYINIKLHAGRCYESAAHCIKKFKSPSQVKISHQL